MPTVATYRRRCEALPNIDPGDISVTGSSGGPWMVAFDGGEFAQANASAISTDAGGLGGALSVSIADAPTDVPPAVTAAAGDNEMQAFSFSPAPDAGTYTLSFDGQTTPAIPFGAGFGAVDLALEALSSVGTGNVIVSGCGGGTCTIEFTGDLRAEDQPLISVDTSGLSMTGLPTTPCPDSNSLCVTDNFIEAAVPNEKQRIALPFGVTSGTFTLEYDHDDNPLTNSFVTGPLSFDSRGSDLDAALELLVPEIGPNDVTVTGPQKGPWTV